MSSSTRIVLGTPGRFHSFDLARQLLQRGMLTSIFTGYPWSKLQNDGIPRDKVVCHPLLRVPAIAATRLSSSFDGLQKAITWWASSDLDRYIARHLPECDAYIALTGSGLEGGKQAQKNGAIYVCDRGSAHIRTQEELLRKGFDAQGVKYRGIDPRVIAKEEAEYALADLILVPSTFAKKSFLDKGIEEDKLLLAPYGVDLAKFSPTQQPDDEYFDILFVGALSIQKGIPELIDAFIALEHPKKRLTLVGNMLDEVKIAIDKGTKHGGVELAGIQSKAEVRDRMSRSHVLVLPSRQDGFGMVMAEAMACGCPVIASDHTGAMDLIAEDVDGLIFPSGDVGKLKDCLQKLVDNPEKAKAMRAASQAKVEKLGGWSAYADIVVAGVQKTIAEKRR